MLLIFWIIIFIIALALMVKGADWLLDSSEKIGLALGFSPFIVGVTIVGMGTSLPELFSSLVATMKGVTEIVAANVVGSNIANIFLIVGVAAVIGKRLVVSKNLIDLDLPLLAIATALFLGVAYDRQITLMESVLLILAYIIYLLYTMKHEENETGDIETEADMPDLLPAKQEKYQHKLAKMNKRRPKINVKDMLLLLAGLVGLVLGAKYVIEAVIKISEMLKMSPAIISITAVAIGTSLPELLVSIKAAMKRKPDVVLGNIFGSNVFNILMVVGVPGLFKTLMVDQATFMIGIPTLIISTLLFIISGISRRVYIWEGALYLLFYVLFVGKLFGLF